MSHIPNITRLRTFVTALDELVDRNPEESELLDTGAILLKNLISIDDWLPESFSKHHPDYYQQYLLYTDAKQRFSVVSFVWGKGQFTPIHNHTVWGLIGVLRGVELSQNFDRLTDGTFVKSGEEAKLLPGEVERVSPTIGDYHQVKNGRNDGPSVSIHVYGGNIGAVKRSVFYEDGTENPFISGYSNSLLPNLWDLSKELKK